MHKVLILLPNKNDRAEAAKLNGNKFEVHFLHAAKDVADKTLGTFAYDVYLAIPSFLTSYVDRAVRYVEENGITAIMYGHDLSSVVASVVCDITGLRGPSLESTFRCLHKYYSRVTEQGKLWFDYVHLDDPESKNWKDKVRFPCFLKVPFLTGSKGQSVIETEEQMVDALVKLKPLVSPYFTGYCEFFQKYLDLEKFPLAVKNIAVVEEVVDSGDQYCVEGWTDEAGEFTLYTIGYEVVCPKKREVLLSWVIPQFTLEKNASEEIVKFTERLGRHFDLRSTFFNVEIWKQRDEFTLVEVNGRCTTMNSEAYRKMWGTSIYEAAMYLACSETDKLKLIPSSASHNDGEPIFGQFYMYTFGEGKGCEFVDFVYARAGCISDGVYNNVGPGLTLFVAEKSPIKQLSSNGFCLGYLTISDHNSANLFRRAKEIISKIVLREEDRV